MSKLETKQKLAQEESVIERGQQTFIAVGHALLVIRDERLYKESGYTSFDTYCKERWGWSKTHANRLIGTAELAPIGVKNEGQARELLAVPASQREEIWVEAQQRSETTGKPVTAALIRDVASGDEPVAKCGHCKVHCPSSW